MIKETGDMDESNETITITDTTVQGIVETIDENVRYHGPSDVVYGAAPSVTADAVVKEEAGEWEKLLMFKSDVFKNMDGASLFYRMHLAEEERRAILGVSGFFLSL